ncbi:calcium-binding protein [Cupriavidus necator]|uniref:calcium-binding protein n=1 Tax=Cupriavidus necator TaxID=106590 RepID=UPI003F4FC30E
MARPGIDNKREQRISMGIVVAAYTEEECAMAWYCHLEDSLSFPFEAQVMTRLLPWSPTSDGCEIKVQARQKKRLRFEGAFGIWPDVRWRAATTEEYRFAPHPPRLV